MPAGSMSLYDDPERSPSGQRGMHVLPASQYLQERLSERRARQLRPKRARHTDCGPQSPRGRDDDIFFAEARETRDTRMYDSSPLVAASSRASDAGTQQNGDRPRRRTVGLRDMDEQMDRLQKQNFALKLELDHRREQTQKLQERMGSMQDQVERALLMEDEHKELLRINSELVQELEKRDRAVEEAMDLICDLEDQVGELQEHSSNTRPSTAHADSGYAGTEALDQDSRGSPPRPAVASKAAVVNTQPPSAQASAASHNLHDALNMQATAKPKRQPSVLSSRQPSTHALRSVYMENSRSLRPVQSFQSLLERQDHKVEEDSDNLSISPRLSVLSESSFPSIYSPKKDLSPDRYDWEVADEAGGLPAPLGCPAHMRQDSIKRVSQWMSARDAVEATPSKSNRISSPLQDESGRHSSASSLGPYQSLNDALSSGVEPVAAPAPPADVDREHHQHHLRKQKSGRLRTRPVSYPVNELHMPPTPDSVSTRMLRESHSSIGKDKSLLDTTPAFVKDYSTLEPGLRTAPRQMRSSVELRTAYNSNLQFRSTALDGHRQEDSSDDEEYIRQEPPCGEKSKDSTFAYDDFPDGGSITMGTPRRFQSHARPPADVMFNHSDISPTLKPPAPGRRRSSQQTIGEPAKSGVSAQPCHEDGVLSVEGVVSPRSARSQRSNSSGNRTVTLGDEQSSRTLSPAASRATAVTSPRSRTSPSPARTLSKKMPKFIRRLSNTMLSEGSPLPTLTSTPSSAYANSGPPRPRTSHADRIPRNNGGATMPRPPSSREIRPQPPIKVLKDMNVVRPASAAGTERERRSLFRRSNSTKKKDQSDGSASDTQQMRGVAVKRRGSIRDVVTSRRPWR